MAMKKLLAMLCAGVLLVGAGCAPIEITIGAKTTQGGTESERTTTTQVTTTESAVRVAIDDLGTPYIGTMVEVEGTATDFHEVSSGYYQIDLYDSSCPANIRCFFFDPVEIAEVAELRMGVRVIVTGEWGDGSYAGGMQNCSIRRADGKPIVPTKMSSHIVDGVCKMSVEEYLNLNFARNSIRGDVLLGGAKVQVTAKVTKVGVYRSFLFLKWWTNYYMYVGNKTQYIDCDSLSYDDYEAISEGDTVTVQGVPGINNNDLCECKIIEIVPSK